MALLVHVPAAATAAVVTVPALTGRRRTVSRVRASYSATPTGGMLTITSAGMPTYTEYVPALGTIDRAFDPPYQGAADATVVVTLASGAGAVLGSLAVETGEIVV